MADLFKVTFFLQHGIGGHSWSLHREDDGYEKAMEAADKLMDVYMPLLGEGVECNYIRVSRTDIPGDARVSARKRVVINNGSGSIPGSKQIKGVIGDSPDPGFTALLVGLGASALQKGRHYMRLIPDITVEKGGQFAFDNNWMTQFKKLKQELGPPGPWGMLAVPKGPGVRKQILSVTEANGAPTQVKTMVPHGFTAGTKIRIAGLAGNPSEKFNGDWVVQQEIDGVTFSLMGSAGTANAAYAQAKPGYAAPTGKTFFGFNADFIEPIRIVSRRNGRPFGQPVGRRRAKK